MTRKAIAERILGTAVEQAVRFDDDQKRLATAQLGNTRFGPVRSLKTGEFLLGRFEGVEVGIRDDRHVLIDGGTRGGKGVSLLVPNLAEWSGSTVVIDPKGENAAITAKRRGSGSAYCHGLGQDVHILDPFNAVASRDKGFERMRAAFNPLDMIRADDPEAIDEAARIADAITERDGTADSFWSDAQAEYIQMIILHVATAPEIASENRNLVTVRNLLTAGDIEAARKASAFRKKGAAPSAFNMLFAAMKRNHAFGGLVSQAGHKFDNLERSSPQLFNSIVQVANTNTAFLKGEAMRRVVSKSTFRLSDLKTSARGCSVYICLSQRYMETHYRWLRMMVTLTLTEMERVKGQPRSGHPVLMVLDEFPALKRMRVVENAAAQIAGFGVKMVFVVQSLAQLKDTYKENWETLVANAGVKLFFCSDDDLTQSYASKLMGEHEVRRYTISYSRASGSSQSTTLSSSSSFTRSASGTTSSTGSSSTEGESWSRTRGISETSGSNKSETMGFSESIHKRPLITPDELGRVFGTRGGKMLALVSGEFPLILDRFSYYADPYFWEKYDPNPDHAPPLTLLESAERRTRLAREAAAERERQRLASERAERERQLKAALEAMERKRKEAERRLRWEQERLRKARIRRVVIAGSCAVLCAALWVFGAFDIARNAATAPEGCFIRYKAEPANLWRWCFRRN